MRKIGLGTLAVASCFALAACGSATDGDTGAGGTSSDAATPAAVEPPVEVAYGDLTADAAAGERVFMQCRACHSLEEGQNGVGPTLYGIVGRTAGTIAGFNYSSANSESGVVFTEEALFEYLASPREFMPGNRMAFPGVRDAQSRADLIAYLAQHGG